MLGKGEHKSDTGDIREPRTRRSHRPPVRPSGWPAVTGAAIVQFAPALRTAAQACAELREQSTPTSDRQ